MRYEFQGVAEVVEGADANDLDVELSIKEGFKGNRDVKLVRVSTEALQYVAPFQTYRALGRQVLVVAVPGQIGDWAAYIGAVPGVSHEKEVGEVAMHGDKLTKALASILFPRFDPAAYRL